MTEEEKVVDAKKIEKLKESINDDLDNILKKSESLPVNTRLPLRSDEDDLDEKDKEIFNYIKDNPEITKQDVVNAFNCKPGYSRKPVITRINKLDKELHMINSKRDKINPQTHRLAVNYENEVAALIAHLDSFKQAYFTLIDKSNSIVNDKYFPGLLGLTENLGFVNALLAPLKVLLNVYTTYDLFSSYENRLDNVTVRKKLVAIYSTIKESQTKLYKGPFKEPRVKCDSFFANTHLYDNLGFLNNMLHSSLWGSGYKNIEEMLVTLYKYGLIKDAELVLDRVWKILYPIFPVTYPRYNKENPDVFKDWRKVMAKYREFDITAQVMEYSKSMAELSP